MRIAVKKTPVYHFSELSDEAKEKVKQWYLDDPIRTDLFSEDCNEWYAENFPNSELKASYSLSYCQGDGYNTTGKLRIYDVIDKLALTDKEKRTLHFYYDELNTLYTFAQDYWYCYSCKSRDKREIEDIVAEDLEDMSYYHWKNVNVPLIKKMYEMIFDYFANIDRQFEKSGYEYFYEADDEEVSECCDANDWEFDANGEFYC